MNPRYRIYAAVGLAGVVLLGGGFMLLGHGGSSGSSAVPVIKPLHPVAKRTKTLARKTTPKATTTGKLAKAKKAAPKVRAKAPLAPPPLRKTDSTKDGMPVALSHALKAHSVVVVSLVVPGAPVDDLAYQEAKAGAAKAGAGFVRINATNNNLVQALSTLVNANADPSNRLLDAPAVLVFRQPQELFVRINGYIDAATIAQAAVNAAPMTKVQSSNGALAGAWVRAANAACDKFNAQIASTTLPTQPDQVLPWIETLLAQTHAAVTTLHGLKPPAASRARVAAMLADYDEMLRDLDAELAAVKHGDRSVLSSLNAKARTAGANGDAIAAALGATSCTGRWS